MATTRYLVVVYVVTAGLHDEDLGSDEEEVVLFTWLVVDISNSKVSTFLLTMYCIEGTLLCFHSISHFIGFHSPPESFHSNLNQPAHLLLCMLITMSSYLTHHQCSE